MKAFDEPLYLTLQDTQWPYTYTDHTRRVARAIVVDDDGYWYFARIHRNDDFAHAVLIETSGGGIEAGETPKEAACREVQEELGAQVEVLAELGVVEDDYNLIHRHNINTYFLCRVIGFGQTHLTEQERSDFHLSTWRLSCEEAIAQYEQCAQIPLGFLLAQRELPMLRRAQEMLAGE